MQPEGTYFEDVEWVQLAQDGIQWKVFVMTTMNLRGPWHRYGVIVWLDVANICALLQTSVQRWTWYSQDITQFARYTDSSFEMCQKNSYYPHFVWDLSLCPFVLHCPLPQEAGTVPTHPVLPERKGIRARKWKLLARNFRVTLRDVFVFAFITRDNSFQFVTLLR